MADCLFDNVYKNVLGALLVEGWDNIDRSSRVKKSCDMLFKVDNVLLFDIDDIEDAVAASGSSFIDGKQHVALVSDDLVEVGVIKTVVTELVFAVAGLKKSKNLGLLCYFQHEGQ